MNIETIRYIVPFTELIASITGTVYFYKYRNTPLRYFLYLLWYITFTEFGKIVITTYHIDALLFYDENGQVYNLWMYNLLRIITFCVLYFVYYKSLKTEKFKLWIKIFFSIYILLTIINWSFIQSFIWEYSELPRVVGSIFLVITILFYFVELLRSEKVIIFHKTLLFWVSVGLLIFYSGLIPFSLKINGYALLPGIHKLFLIVTILATAMYLIFTFGFIWSKKE